VGYLVGKVGFSGVIFSNLFHFFGSSMIIKLGVISVKSQF